MFAERAVSMFPMFARLRHATGMNAHTRMRYPDGLLAGVYAGPGSNTCNLLLDGAHRTNNATLDASICKAPCMTQALHGSRSTCAAGVCL